MDQDPRVALAIERTFLAWIRTGIALMGLGFVVARFSLLLRELAPTSSLHLGSSQNPGLSLWIGISMLGLGVMVDILASWRYYTNLKGRQRGQGVAIFEPALGVLVGILLAVLAIVMGVYLVSLA